MKTSLATNVKLPLFGSRISAGFASPADDYLEKHLDLNEYLIQKPAATFFVKVSGDSMNGVGIFHEDLLIIDRSVEPKNNSIVLAVLGGEFIVKRLIKKSGKIFLKAENPNYPLIEIKDENDFEVWGVVIHCIHSFK